MSPVTGRCSITGERLHVPDSDRIIAPWHDGSDRVLKRFRAVESDTAHGCAAAYYPETNPLVPLDSTGPWEQMPGV